MIDTAELGKRYTCYECGTKFYDLNRDKAECPECKADQAEAPTRDIRSLLSGRGRPRVEEAPAPAAVESESESESDDDDEFDDLGLEGGDAEDDADDADEDGEI